ncbi:MAG: O-antigen ligase family protein [Acidobacteriota bacterium]
MLVLAVVTNYYDFYILGYRFRGWAWVLILVASMLRIASARLNVMFPVWIWAPWAAYVFIRAFSGYEYVWQSTAQILCPLVAGIAASTYRLMPVKLESVQVLIRRAYAAFLAGFLLIIVPFSVRDIDNSGFAAGAMTALFFQSFFLCSYFLNGRSPRDVMCYLAAIGVPVVSGNRGPLLASVGLLVLAIVPISVRRRILLAGVAAAIGIAAFYTPKFQHKMFYSGRGELADLHLDNRDLRMNARTEMWRSLEQGIALSPWVGHGGNADRTWLLRHGFAMYLPHNDWLRLRFNYGWVGVVLFILAIGGQIVHSVRTFWKSSPGLRALSASGVSCFVAFVIVMLTDNVLIYCQYFTVPMMLLVGGSYSVVYRRPTLLAQSRRQKRMVGLGRLVEYTKPVARGAGGREAGRATALA